MLMSGHVGGFTSAGVILVLFILLVIVICGCTGLGGYGGGYGPGNMPGNVAGVASPGPYKY